MQKRGRNRAVKTCSILLNSARSLKLYLSTDFKNAAIIILHCRLSCSISDG